MSHPQDSSPQIRQGETASHLESGYGGAPFRTLGAQSRTPRILQVLPELVTGGVERGTVEVAAALKEAGWTPLVASAGGAMTYDLQRVGAEHIELPLASKNYFVVRKNAERLRKVIREKGVDLVHARSRAPAWSAYWACKAEGIPFVTTFHGTYGHGSRLKRAYNSVMVKGDLVIAISEHIRRHVMEVYGCPPEKIRMIHRGVDTRIFAPEAVSAERVIQLAQQWRLPEDLPLVLLPGRLTRWKGQTLLIEALAQIKDLEFACVLVGSDQGRSKYSEELKQLIAAKGLESRVWLVDHCNDMAAAYMLANVVVSPSLEPEAFGRVIAEAQALGRPVVAAAHGGALEQVIEGITGTLVTPGDAGALAEGLRWALGLTHHQREQVAAAAITHIRNNFTKERMTGATLDLYAELLSHRLT
jgi:glycosyltransferase involved in cell wall biosynthesis